MLHHSRPVSRFGRLTIFACALAFAVPGATQSLLSTTDADREAADREASRTVSTLSGAFTDIWGEAEASPLFLKPQPVAIDFEAPPSLPWSRGAADPAWKAMPPREDGLAVPPGTDVQSAWSDWFKFDFARAVQSKDAARIRASAHAWLAWNEAGRAPPDVMNNPRGEYYRALGSYRDQLAPDVAGEMQKSVPNFASLKPGEQFGALIVLGRDKALVAKATRAALEELPSVKRRDLAVVDRIYLRMSLSEKDKNWEDLAERAGLIAEIADLEGNGAIAEQWRAASAAMRRNDLTTSYGWSMKYRHQNIVIGRFETAMSFTRNWEKAARDLFSEDDPRLLRVTLSAAADYFGGNHSRGGNFYAEKVQLLCQKQGCGDVRKLPEYPVLVASLTKFASPENAAAFTAAVTGTKLSAGTAHALTNLETIPTLKQAQQRCLITVGSKPGARVRSTSGDMIDSPAFARESARCDVDAGRAIIAAYRAAGVSAAASEDYQNWIFDTASALFKLDEYAEATTLLDTYVSLPAADGSFTGLIARSMLVETAVQAKNWPLASQRNAALKDYILKQRAAKTIGAVDYLAFLRGFDRSQVAIWLGSDDTAHRAFELAAERAQESRESRQDGRPGVFTETRFARSLAFNREFVDAANASWARFSLENAGQALPVSRWDSFETGFEAIQDALTDRTSLALAYAVADQGFPGVTPEVQKLIRRRRVLIEELAPSDGVNGGVQASDLIGQSQLDIEQADRFAEAKRREYRDIDQSLQRLAPDYFNLVRPRPLPVAEAQALLAPDEVALLLLPSDRGTHIFAITRESARWHRSNWNADQVGDAVRRLRWFAGARIGPATDAEFATWTDAVDGGTNGYDRDTAYALYKELIDPVSDTLATRRHLFVIAGGPLGSLPLNVLVTAPPEGRDDDPQALRTTPWMADTIAMSYLPSLQSLAFLRAANSKKSVEGKGVRFLGFGDPDLKGGTEARGARGIRGGTADPLFANAQSNDLSPETLRNRLARLPGTRNELEAIAGGLKTGPTSLFMGSADTETRFKSSKLGDIDVLVIATHALVAGELPGAVEPGLVFTPPATASTLDDGYLTASEIARLRMEAGWVILSACNTAAGDGSEGAPGMSGLARSFFYAGAKSLLASHWPVRDDAAPSLTLNAILASQASPNGGRATALRDSMRKLRNDPSRDGMLDRDGIDLTFAHPAAWAPFVLIGDGSN